MSSNHLQSPEVRERAALTRHANSFLGASQSGHTDLFIFDSKSNIRYYSHYTNSYQLFTVNGETTVIAKADEIREMIQRRKTTKLNSLPPRTTSGMMMLIFINSLNEIAENSNDPARKNRANMLTNFFSKKGYSHENYQRQMSINNKLTNAPEEFDTPKKLDAHYQKTSRRPFTPVVLPRI